MSARRWLAARFPTRASRLVAVLVVLNELRGIIMVGTLLWEGDAVSALTGAGIIP